MSTSSSTQSTRQPRITSRRARGGSPHSTAMNPSVSHGPSSPGFCASARMLPSSHDRSPWSRRARGSTAGWASRRFVCYARRTNIGVIWNGSSPRPAPAGISLPTLISRRSRYLTAPRSFPSTTTSPGFRTSAGPVRGVQVLEIAKVVSTSRLAQSLGQNGANLVFARPSGHFQHGPDGRCVDGSRRCVGATRAAPAQAYAADPGAFARQAVAMSSGREGCRTNDSATG